MINDPELKKIKWLFTIFVGIVVFFLIVNRVTQSHHQNNDKKQLPQQSWLADNGRQILNTIGILSVKIKEIFGYTP